MYAIITYDVNVERVNKVKKFLRQYLNWIQNSVFEGEVSKSDLEEIRIGIREIIDENEDMVVVYLLPSQKNLSREVIGFDKSNVDQII